MSKEITLLVGDDRAAVRSTINLIQTPVYLIDVDEERKFRFFAVNESEERVIGLKQDQVEGRRLEDVLDPGFADRRQDALRRCAQTRSVVEFENFIDCPDGRHWGRGTLVPLFDAQERLKRIMGTARDITDQKRAEEDLKKTTGEFEEQITRQFEDEQRFERVFHQGPIGMALVDLNSRVLKANNALCTMLGYTQAELTGKKTSDFTHPDDVRIDAKWTEQLANDEIPSFQGEKRYVRKDGRVVSARVTGTVVRDGDGKPLYGLGMAEDISAQKRAEEDLGKTHEELQHQKAKRRQGEERFRRVFDEGPLAMALVDMDRKIIEVNQSLCDFLGYSEDELLGMDGDTITHPDDLETSRGMAQRLFTGEIPCYKTEKKYVRKDGQQVWAMLTASLIRDENGQPLYGLAMAENINDRKLAEESARRATSLFENAERMTRLGSWELDLESHAIHCSDEFCRQWQLEPGQSLHKRSDARSRIHPDDQWIAETAHRTLLESGRVEPVEYRLLLPDNSIKHVQMRATLVRETGRPNRIVGISVDITDRKEKEDAIKKAQSQLESSSLALRSSELRFRTLLESSPDGILVTSSNGKIFLVNARTEEMFGYTRDELIGTSVETLIPPILDDGHREEEKEDGRHQRVLKMATEHSLSGRRKDGSEIPVEITLNPTEVEGEAVTLAMIRDVTDSRAALEARLQLASIVDASTDAIIRMDLDGKVVGWNKGAERLFGYTADEMIGNFSSQFAGPEQYEEQERNRKMLLRGEALTIPETVRMRKDGRPVDVSASVFPLKNTSGKIIGLAAIARDITDQLKLRRQFQEAQRLEAIGKLAGGIAHDFNNILTVISGYSSLIQDYLPDDSPIQTSLRAQSKASERGAALTRQLLAFGRKQRFEPKVLELNNAVSELHNVLHRTLGEDVDLVTVLASKGYVEADPAQLEQVIVNLAVNARHAMPRGGKLKIETSDVELDEAGAGELGEIAAGRYCVLTVTDTGTGMDRDTVLHIFEPFFTTKERGKGSGLGLAAVYGIVKQSKGAISVESSPGVGTVFEIYLPQVPSPVLDFQEIPSDKEIPRGTGTILLVEDDEDLKALAATVLRERGFSVVEVTGVRQAEEAVAGDTKIDLVLTDVVMPETSGPQLVKRLHALRSDFKVLYMSGYTDNTSEAYRLARDSQLIDKPFTPADLVRKVHEMLGGS